jgi:hypothetical protein
MPTTTDQIEVTGVINPATVGTQSLNYQVTDRAGNISTAIRTVNVGVNAGKGGGGGGATAPVFLILLTVLVALRRRFIHSL